MNCSKSDHKIPCRSVQTENFFPLQQQSFFYRLEQGSPTRPHRRRWTAGEWAKLHRYLKPLPITRNTTWFPPAVRSAAALGSHRSVNPTVNCVCEGSWLRAPYENPTPDDLRWSWGGDASAGEQLQIQIIISREVWLHRDHNKSMACRHIKTLSGSGKWKQTQGSHWFCIMVSHIIISLYITM